MGPATFNGKPCRTCGSTERYVKRGRCVRCILAKNSKRAKENLVRDRAKRSAASSRWAKTNAARMRELQTRWASAHPDHRRAAYKKWRDGHPERVRELQAKYYQKHIVKKRLAHRNWTTKNKVSVRAYNAARKARKIQRTPAYANLEAIARFFRDCPSGYHVDHVIPLRGKLVSGFHLETNLQYLTKTENQTKHNRFEPIFTSGEVN